MADVAVLKEFLVAIGYKSDEHSQKKMVDAIAAVGVKAAELGVVLTGVAAGAVASVAKIADGMERLYFASRRTHAAVGNIQAFGFAAANMGSSAAAAEGSLESLARFLRSSPGAAGLLNSLGIATQVHGHARDATDIMADLGRKFAEMPLNSGRGQAYASLFGIDEKTFLAMRQGMGQFSAEYKRMLTAADFDADKAAKSSHYFMTQVRTLGSAISILVQKVASELTGRMGYDIQGLRTLLVANFGRISDAITKGITFLVSVGDVITRLAIRASQAMSDLAAWFGHLNHRTKEIIKTLGLLTAAWTAFSVASWLIPGGIVVKGIMAIGAAILLLYDDYKTWKEGGQHLIPWGRWKPEIDAAVAGLGNLWTAIKGINWKAWLPDLDKLGAALADLGNAIGGVSTRIGALSKQFWALFGADVMKALNLGWDTLKAIGRMNFRVLIDGLHETAALLRGDWKGAWVEAKDSFTTVIQFMEKRFAAFRDTIGDIIDDVVKKLDWRHWVAKLDAGGRWLLGKITGMVIPSANAAETGGVGRPAGVSGRAPPDAINEAMKFFAGHWGVVRAAGIVSNALGESGLNPTATSPDGGAHGLFQWRGARAAAMEAYFGKPIEQVPYMDQLRYAEHELETSEAFAGRKLGEAQTPGDASEAFNRYFERSGQDYVHSARNAQAVSIAQNTNIHVAAGPTSQDTAERVARQQSRINADLLRNTKAHAS